MISDRVNGGNTHESAAVVLNRLEEQIVEKWRKQDILGLAEDIYSVVSEWANLKRDSDVDDPYIYLEHKVEIKRTTARTYFGIGKALREYGENIEGQKYDRSKINSPYMLLYVDKALKHHWPSEVKEALESMSYRPFKDFASQGEEKSPKSEAKEAATKSDDNKMERENLKARFREQFDKGKEVYIVAVSRREQWDFIRTKLQEWAGIEEQQGEIEAESTKIDEIQSDTEAA